jgi:hypothetical protein
MPPAAAEILIKSLLLVDILCSLNSFDKLIELHTSDLETLFQPAGENHWPGEIRNYGSVAAGTLDDKIGKICYGRRGEHL